MVAKNSGYHEEGPSLIVLKLGCLIIMESLEEQVRGLTEMVDQLRADNQRLRGQEEQFTRGDLQKAQLEDSVLKMERPWTVATPATGADRQQTCPRVEVTSYHSPRTILCPLRQRSILAHRFHPLEVGLGAPRLWLLALPPRSLDPPSELGFAARSHQEAVVLKQCLLPAAEAARLRQEIIVVHNRGQQSLSPPCRRSVYLR
ncbi:unnamed protein product [Boreogadus saida]